jgi:hypothetical protein
VVPLRLPQPCGDAWGCLPPAWGCVPAVRSPTLAHGTGRFSPWGGQSARPAGPSALVARGIWTPSALGVGRGCGARARQGWGRGAPAPQLGHTSRARRRGPRPCALALGARKPPACVPPVRPWGRRRTRQTPRPMPRWAAGGAMRGPPRWRAVPPAWPRSRRLGDVWQRGRTPTRRPSARGEPRGEAARQRLGRARRGTAPQPVDETPDATAQTPGPAPEWQRRRTNHNGWEYGGEAPARVEAASQLLVACALPTASHDTQPAAPMARRTGAHLAQASRARPTDATGAAQTLPAPSARGSDSAAAAAAVAQRGCEPSLATGRQRHHASEAEERQPPATAQARRVATGRTPTGRALDARRQVSVAPVCGQSTAARGLRRLLWRGLDHIRGAWPLVCVPPNLRKLWRYPCAPITVSAAAMAP